MHVQLYVDCSYRSPGVDCGATNETDTLGVRRPSLSKWQNAEILDKVANALTRLGNHF